MFCSAIWNWLRNKLLVSPLPAFLHESAINHLSQYGYSGVRVDSPGIQYTIELRYCEISLWRHKLDVGSSIRPISGNSRVRYESKQVDERMVEDQTVRSEIDRQILLIRDNYQAILQGNFGDWPKQRITEGV